MSESCALVFTDVVDSTQLNARLGDERMNALWQQHDRAARDLIRSWRGREIGRSDGFLALFPSADDALGFTLGYRAFLAQLPVPWSARAGLHVGPVTLRENREEDVRRGATPFEVDGLALPIVARLLSAAPGGQVLLSAQSVQALPAARVGLLQPLGWWRIKGLDEPVQLWGLGDAEPPADTPKAYRVVAAGDAWQPARALPHNLPAERDRFVGRRGDLRALAQRFDGGARLVTLLGMGGIGKTRTALRYARAWLGDHPGGAWFCDLSAARSLEGVLQVVAQALDVPLAPDEPVRQIGAAIAARGPCLVVLDNFEHVAVHAEPTLGRWLEASPWASFLVTSREALGIAGEALLPLQPLPPDDAVTLLHERMRSAHARVPAEPQQTLAALVELLDRLPLAIELAAARSSVMSAATLLQRMDERFKLLVARGGRHDRQATLQATLDWSWELLGEDERLALAQLSVFEGGFTMEAAEAVVEPAAAGAWVPDLVQALLEKSLLRDGADYRFGMLRTVQEYAARQLDALSADAGLREGAEARHARFFSRLCEAAVMDRRCDDLDNLVAACRRASSMADAASAVAALSLCATALTVRGAARTVLDLCEAADGIAGLGSAQRARVQLAWGTALYRLGRRDEALAAQGRALDAAHGAGDDALAAQVACAQAEPLMRAGQVDEARALLRHALETATRRDDARLHYMAVNGLGAIALHLGELEAARAHLLQALALTRRLSHRRWEGGVLGNLAALTHMDAQFDEAAAYYREAIAISDEVHDRQWAANGRCNLALLHHDRGEHEQAQREFEAVLASAREMGHLLLEATVLCNLGLVQRARGDAVGALERFEQGEALARRIGDRRLEAQCRAERSSPLATVSGPCSR